MKLNSSLIRGASHFRNLVTGTALALVVGLAVPACGGISALSPNSSASSGVLGLAPDSVDMVSVVDVGEVLQGDVPEMAGDIVPGIEAWLEVRVDETGVVIDDVDVLAITGKQGRDQTLFLEGEFDFDHIRGVLDDADYEDDDYRGYELWRGRGIGGGYDIALLEDDGYVIMGLMSGAAEDVLRSLGRDRLLLKADDNPLKRVLDRVDQSWSMEAAGFCHWDVRGCDAMAIATVTGDDYTVEFTIVLLFGSERSARSGERRIDNILEQAAEEIRSLDYDEVKADGEFIIVKLWADEDALSDLLAQLSQRPRLNVADREPTPRSYPPTPVVVEVIKEVEVTRVVEKPVVVEVVKEVEVTSSSAILNCWVKGFQLDARIIGGEAPVHSHHVPVALVLPGVNFPAQHLLIRNPAVQALPGQHSDFNFSHVQPTPMLGGVVNLQTFGNAPRFHRLERLV